MPADTFRPAPLSRQPLNRAPNAAARPTPRSSLAARHAIGDLSIGDLKFAALRCGIYFASLLALLHWLTLPATLIGGEAVETAAMGRTASTRGDTQAMLTIPGHGLLMMGCSRVDMLCSSEGLGSRDRELHLSVQWVGLLREPWIISARTGPDGLALVEPLSQERQYLNSKRFLGWLSLLSVSFAGFLLWAGPYRRASESTSTFPLTD